MSNQIVPPLKIYFYSPQSIANSSNATGVLNNNFFNPSNTLYSTATQISVNKPSNSFNKDIFSHTYNGQTKLYLNNNSNILSEPIGNVLSKKMVIKLNPENPIYTNNGLHNFFIYDSNNFNYGIIIYTFSENYFYHVNSNGFTPDGIYYSRVIYADGYYSYLVRDLNSQTATITTTISNGIRTMEISPDPTGKYDPNNNIFYERYPAFYYGPYNSTYQNNTVIPIQDYNIYSNIYLERTLNPQTKCGNLLFQNCITNNLNYPSNYDMLYTFCFSVQKSFNLSLSGNILGLLVASDLTLANTGGLEKTTSSQNIVIIYADGDFDYLNEINTPYAIKLNINPETGLRTVNLPIKPSNYIPPILSFLPNQFVNGNWIWNDFYVGKKNNSIIYDSTIPVQNYTLATTQIYDSYDFINNKPGLVIGNAISYTNVSKTSESTQLHFTFTQYNFNNGSLLFTCYVSTVSLNKVGGLPNNYIIYPNVFSSSNNYISNGNILYNIKLTTGAIIDHVQTQTILLL